MISTPTTSKPARAYPTEAPPAPQQRSSKRGFTGSLLCTPTSTAHPSATLPLSPYTPFHHCPLPSERSATQATFTPHPPLTTGLHSHRIAHPYAVPLHQPRTSTHNAKASAPQNTSVQTIS